MLFDSINSNEVFSFHILLEMAKSINLEYFYER